MPEHSIYQDIAERTGGDVYIGVVGPVRTGKSTFIKRFMEALVLPNIGEGYSRERARVVAISEIGLGDMLDYVRVDGVRLVDQERGLAWCDMVDGADLESSLRHFTDDVDILTVATLNSCDYATERIDDGVVTLIGVVDSYRGELVLRLSDRKIFVPSTL